ncbi:MAG TPA: glycosyltransferase [Aggregatilineales bacterium]|nr:glycosyltransferase [Aggregatilineales bacterium]
MSEIEKIEQVSESPRPQSLPVSQPGSPLVSIILATYNERENIQDTITAIFECVRAPVEVIVVDDDSPDETWRIVEKMDDPRIVLIRRVATKGLASAFNRGIIESRGEVVGWMDADMCMPPAMLPAMIEKLQEVDIVIGSRYAPGGVDDRQMVRVLARRLINRAASFVLGYGIQDYDSGFVVLRRSVFNKVSIIPTGYGAYFMEFLYVASRKGLTVYEMPYHFTDRARGVSKSAPDILSFVITGMGYFYRIFEARFLRRFE